MTDFDPIKALREEIQGLNDIILTLSSQERRVMATMTEAEITYNGLLKVRAFAAEEMDRKRKILHALMEEQAK